jgi:CheY-like chemotaxis protein
VLLIDDDRTSRYLISGLLANTNCHLGEAEGGLEGLRLARESKPDLIVLDLSMPDLSGFELIECLKSDPETRNIPVVICTSKLLDDEDHARLSGAVAVISKSGISSRELAMAQFAEGFEKAGLECALKIENQPVGAQLTMKQESKGTKTILCIDNDQPGLVLRKMMSESEGYRVFTAASGEEGSPS